RHRADVAGGLDPAPLDEDRLAGHDVGLEVGRQRAGGVGFLHRGDPVAAEDHQDVVEIVTVDVAVLARLDRQLPDPHTIVLEHDPVAHRPEDPLFDVAHVGSLSSRCPPTPARQKCTRWSVCAAVGRVTWIRWSRRVANTARYTTTASSRALAAPCSDTIAAASRSTSRSTDACCSRGNASAS